MRKYELMAIINPSLSEEEKNSLVDFLKKNIKKFSGKVTKEDLWGEKKMAYKIKKSDTGFYVLFEIEIDGTKLKDLTSEINMEKEIWRHIFVSKED